MFRVGAVGAVGAVDPNGGATLISSVRQAFVGLKKNGVGSALIGSQNTVIYDAVLATDPSGVNNMGGNLITVSSVGPQVTSTTNTATASPTGTGLSVQGITNNIGYNTRVANALQFKSDNFAGFTARLMYVGYNANATETTVGGAGAGVECGHPDRCAELLRRGADAAWHRRCDFDHRYGGRLERADL